MGRQQRFWRTQDLLLHTFPPAMTAGGLGAEHLPFHGYMIGPLAKRCGPLSDVCGDERGVAHLWDPRGKVRKAKMKNVRRLLQLCGIYLGFERNHGGALQRFGGLPPGARQ